MDEDDKEAHADNLCKRCYTLAALKHWQWKAAVEKKSHRGRQWRMQGKDQYVRGMWEYFSLERLKAKKFLKDAEKEQQEGIQG